MRLTFDQLSLHKMWKWSWFCENEVTIDYYRGFAVKLRNTCRRSHSGCLVNLAQWFPKYGSKPKQAPRRVKKWVAHRGSKPGLCVFKVTTACLCVA